MGGGFGEGPLARWVPASLMQRKQACSCSTAAGSRSIHGDPEGHQLSLTTWFLAFDLIGQAKTGISSLALSRHLGGNDDTAWLAQQDPVRDG